MGTVYKRGNKYYINVTADGKRIRKPIGKSKRLAELALKDLELKIMRKELDLDTPDSSLQALFEGFTSYSHTNHAPASYKRYQNVISNFRLVKGGPKVSHMAE